MKKRGSMLTIIAIFGVLVGGIVLYAYIKISEVYGTGQIAVKTAATRDIALILDTMYAYPYDMEITYESYDLSEFIIVISQNSVKMYNADFVTLEDNEIKGKDLTSTKYSFTPVNDELDLILDRPAEIIFKKINGELIIIG